MDSLLVRGGRPLVGTVEIKGAKNAALPILAATVLHGGTYMIENCPDISDVDAATEILRALGGWSIRNGNTLLVDTRGIDRWCIPGSLMVRIRASVLFLGPLLARFGRAELTMPGGCPLGSRPIDLHLQAMAAMGASVTLRDGVISCETSGLHGCSIAFSFPSVGATENALLAATACCGTVTITNAAMEPEITDLVDFLRTMGAEISGTGSNHLTVHGGLQLQDAVYRVMPDRIETATYLCAAAACGGAVTLLHTDGSLLKPVLDGLVQAGCVAAEDENGLHLWSDGSLQAIGQITTAPYPGFPTDAQALMMAAMLRATGETRFSETVFDMRFGHGVQMRRFGGQIDTYGNSARVRGVRQLYGAKAEADDLRAAAALVIAALQTPEESVITGIKHLHRGYDNLEGNLRTLGAEIRNKTTGNFNEYSV